VGSGTGNGVGSGTGDGFGPGNGPAEPQREVRFEPDNLLDYARFLDFFKIELGVLGQDNKIHYAYNLSHKTPDVRDGDPASEQRLFMNSARGRFAPLDRQLVTRAKLAEKGRIVLQFYPAEAQAILNRLEQDRAQAAGKKRKRFVAPSFGSCATKSNLSFKWKINLIASGWPPAPGTNVRSTIDRNARTTRRRQRTPVGEAAALRSPSLSRRCRPIILPNSSFKRGTFRRHRRRICCVPFGSAPANLGGRR